MVEMRRMTRKEAIEILEKYNEWRRFDGETRDNTMMQDPKLIGEAIDVVLDYARSVIER
jgi:hypothetical protein